MAIKHNTAYKLAIKALELDRASYLYDARTYEEFPAYETGKKAAKQVDRINQAICIITEDHLEDLT